MKAENSTQRHVCHSKLSHLVGSPHAIWEDFWDGLVSESRRKEKGIPYEKYRATRLKRARPRE
jgi:hypothetical protein